MRKKKIVKATAIGIAAIYPLVVSNISAYGDTINSEYNQNNLKEKGRNVKEKTILQIHTNLEKATNLDNTPKNEVIFNNVWNQDLGTLKINLREQKFEFINGWAEVNPYLSSKAEAFGVYLYNKSGVLLNCYKAYGSAHPEEDLNKLLNEKTFQYGEYIRIQYIQSAHIQANIDNKSLKINKDIIFKINKNGLEEVGINPVSVEPFNVLGCSNEAPTSGILKGKTTEGNTEVNIKINNEIFTGKSDENGDFAIKIKDTDGFTKETNIYVSALGNITKIINPTVADVGLSKSFVGISTAEYPEAYWQKVGFNIGNMAIDCDGGEFVAQLLNNENGKIIGTTSGSNFIKVASKGNLNGAKFKYGDVLSVVESAQANLTIGKMKLGNPSGISDFTSVNKFTNFEITPNGLVKMDNKNLKVNPILYKGNSTVTVSGTTLPNSTLIIRYGNIEKEIKASQNGDFNYAIPMEDTSIGGEVSVYLNSTNMVNELVQYDTKVINVGNNKIEIYNNDGFNIFNIGFNPVNEKLEVAKVFLTKTYAGLFYGNHLTISLIDKNSGKVLESYTGNKPGEIDGFINEFNNKQYQKDGIIKISYNPNYVEAKVMNGKNSIGNSTGSSEYFRITNKGLINITNKFITVNKFDILSNKEVKNGFITGKVSKDAKVNVIVEGKVFTGISDENGNFKIKVEDSNGFNENTEIEVTSKDYMPTITKPVLQKNISIGNSFINFYKDNFEVSKLISSIGFNPYTEKFIVNNYQNSFGDGKEEYFTLGYYNNHGKEIWEKSFNNGSVDSLTDFLKDKSFAYGDEISLQYNNKVSIPVVLSNINAISNISGTKEYFRITKRGLENISHESKPQIESNNYKIKINNEENLKNLVNKINNNLSSNKESVKNIIANSNDNNDLITISFINEIGEQNLIQFINENNTNKKFLTWVLNNKQAMEYFLEGYQTGEPIKALGIWKDIWTTYGNSRGGFNLQIAVATALANTNTTPSAWPNYGPVGSPVERYNIFETLNAENGMLPVFRTLNVRLLEMVVGTPLPNNQIMMARRIILQNHNGLINDTVKGLNNIAYTMDYDYTNPHNGINVFAPGFYPKHPTIANVWYDGGVCGATAQMGAVGPNVFGVPSKFLYQPGHVVFIYYMGKENKWQLGNDIYGWGKTVGGDISNWSDKIADSKYVASYDILYNKAITMNLNESNEYAMLAKLNVPMEEKMNSINEAIKIDPYNLGAWLEKINLMNSVSTYTADDYMKLANEIITTFKNYPMPMFDTLLQIKQMILQRGSTYQYNEFVSEIKNALTNNTTQKQEAQMMIDIMPKNGLVLNQTKNLGEITISSWTSANTANLIFENGKINTLGGAYWLGENLNRALVINMYSKDGKLLKATSFNGEQDGGDNGSNTVEAELANTNYKLGDIITVYYTPGKEANGKVHYTNAKGFTIVAPNESQYEITKDGLIPLPNSYMKNGEKVTFSKGQMNVIDMSYKIQGAKNETISFGQSFNPMEGISVEGVPNKYIKVEGNVNTKKPGKYTLTYTVSYRGKEGIATRVIEVNNNYKIEINGLNKGIINFGEKFNDLKGVTVTDPAEDANIKIKVIGTVNTLKPGSYTLTYIAKDAYGKEVTENRVVEVNDLYKIKLIGFTNEHISFGSKFNDMEGLKVEDPAEESNPTIKLISGKVNTYKPGVYILKYEIKDKSEKKLEIERIITVDNNYFIIVHGIKNEKIPFNSKFNPMENITIVDPAIGANPKIQLISGNVDTKKSGKYILKYQVEDAYGKVLEVSRKIEVEQEVKLSDKNKEENKKSREKEESKDTGNIINSNIKKSDETERVNKNKVTKANISENETLQGTSVDSKGIDIQYDGENLENQKVEYIVNNKKEEGSITNSGKLVTNQDLKNGEKVKVIAKGKNEKEIKLEGKVKNNKLKLVKVKNIKEDQNNKRYIDMGLIILGLGVIGGILLLVSRKKKNKKEK
ncbi:MAG: immunoglobulin-like domain-containing protein [Clostridium sp.]